MQLYTWQLIHLPCLAIVKPVSAVAGFQSDGDARCTLEEAFAQGWAPAAPTPSVASAFSVRSHKIICSMQKRENTSELSDSHSQHRLQRHRGGQGGSAHI